VVLDSGSTDATAAIAAEFPNVRVLIVRPFDDHTTQWNFGVDATRTNWVLSLDCDYVLGPGFEDELAALPG
jgi:glycosyltransferase involved in cell wall biosynthesis